MSGTFIYRPPTIPIAYDVPFQRTPYTYTPRPSTPFVPDYPYSPYSRPSSLNASPIRGAVPLPPGCYVFPATPSAYQTGYDVLGEPRRDRLPLWQPPWAGALLPFSTPLYDISNLPSASAGISWYPLPFGSPYPPSLQIHPLLNAEVPITNFFFDISSHTPAPLLYYHGGEIASVPPENLSQPMSYPAITRLRIVSDNLPQEWEINLALPPELSEYYVRLGYDPPPITVQDVLQAVYRDMQRPISHIDWAKLSRADVENVRRAFTRRCRAAPGGQDGYEVEMAKGVKRVDYLWGSTRFVGLLKVGREDGCETVKLVTTDPYQPI